MQDGGGGGGYASVFLGQVKAVEGGAPARRELLPIRLLISGGWGGRGRGRGGAFIMKKGDIRRKCDRARGERRGEEGL